MKIKVKGEKNKREAKIYIVGVDRNQLHPPCKLQRL